MKPASFPVPIPGKKRLRCVKSGQGTLVGEHPNAMNGSCCSLAGPLTNLPVRQNLSAAVDLARGNGRKASVLVLKISDLTEINHWKGYEVGDLLIQSTMNRVTDCLFEGEFVGRLGGGHFLIFICDEYTSDTLASRIQQLLACVSEPVESGAGRLPVNASVGASLMPDDAVTAEELLRNAELALRSSEKGESRFYSPDLGEHLASNAEVRAALAGALEREEFFLLYQPQICVASGRLCAVEALLRWQSLTLGLVPPDRFIPIAESIGMMPRLGDWVLENACRQAGEWLAQGTPLRVAVNISAVQLGNAGFADGVRQVLERHCLPADLLELEVTESMLVGDVFDCQRALTAIRNAGVKLALDDFGTGYSNLAYLRHFTFDTLKIDRLFTCAVTQEHSGDALVRAIVAMGAELCQDIVAEGIETAEQAIALQNLWDPLESTCRHASLSIL